MREIWLGLALAVAACSFDDTRSTDEAAATRLDALEQGTALTFEKSFVVVDQKSLSAVESDFTMGGLLYAVNQYNTSLIAQWNIDHPDDPRKPHTDLAFAMHAFEAGSLDVQNNNAADMPVGTVIPSVDSWGERIVPRFDPDKDPKGPFRLLAVVNRLDLAGDFDLRGGGELAGAERRWFGEGRLVFGLQDPLDPITPFPMTFIMEFRLPALKRNAGGDIVVDKNFDLARGPVSMDDWIARRKLWALTWKKLSNSGLGTPAYTAALHAVVSMFATGQNHVAMRSGEQVRRSSGKLTNELEYREFYLDGTWMLATRKLRREPFACSQKSGVLSARIETEWNASTQTMEWNYMLGERNLTKDEVTALTSGCGGQLPYGQTDDVTGDTQLRAKFARFEPSTVWTPYFLVEERRHQFAIGTCSGCHAGETNGGGFQIKPSLAGQNATLSTFLSGKTSANPNGTTYSYDEPARRTDLLEQFLASVDVPGDMLHHLECHDHDTCK